MTDLVKLKAVQRLRIQRERLARGRAASDRGRETLEGHVLDDLHRQNADGQTAATRRLRRAVTDAEGLRDAEARFGSIAMSMMLLQDELARIEMSIEDQRETVKQATLTAKESRQTALGALRSRIKSDRMVHDAQREEEVRNEEREADELNDLWSTLRKVRRHA